MTNPLKDMHIRDKQYGKTDPVSNTFGMVRQHGHRPHQGWDLQAPVGTLTYAISNGRIEFVGNEPSGYGRQVCLSFQFRSRTLYAFYGHLSVVSVTKGQEVREGQILGMTGRTGNASKIPGSEAHLHFEIRTKALTGKGLGNRMDPGEVLGYAIYSCR